MFISVAFLMNWRLQINWKRFGNSISRLMLLDTSTAWHNKKLPQNKCQRMEEALIFEFSHHQMESTSGKSIPSILNRKRKLTTSSQKTFMVNIYYRICVFKCGFQTIYIWANLAQYFFQSENQSFPKFCISTLHSIFKSFAKTVPFPKKHSLIEKS